MTWKNNLSLGIPNVDNQHKQMCDSIDNLYAACSEGKGKDEVLNILNFLESYVIEHFTAEEKLQLDINYPKYRQHKKTHKEFTDLVLLLRKEIDTYGPSSTLVIKMNKSLSAWLVNHIMYVDMDIKKYIK